MAQIKEVLTNIIKFHKLKIVSVFVFFLIFFILLFPYNDLSELLSSQVVKISGGQVFLTFDRMGLGFSPSPSLQLTNVSLAARTLTPVQLESLDISPSIADLLTFRVGGKIGAQGLWGGQALISLSGLSMSDPNGSFPRFSIDLKNVDASKLKTLYPTPYPIPINGNVSADIAGSIDLTFTAPPEVNFDFSIIPLVINPASVNTPMGEIAIPEVRFGQLIAQGRLVGQEFIIENGQLGQAEDVIYGRFKGKMGLELIQRGGQVTAQLSSYEYRVELTVKDAVPQSLGLVFMLLDQVKQNVAQGKLYRFRISGLRMDAPPQIEALSRF